jgi:MFS family permease
VPHDVPDAGNARAGRPLAAGAASRYRWLVLVAGTAAQTSFSAVLVGLPVLAPVLRDEFDLSLFRVGVVLDGLWVGALLTLLPWGLLADRVGERIVIGTGLAGCGTALIASGYAGSFEGLVILLGLAGAAGASVNSASGRAVMQWFPAAERGLALGVRQTAIPLGGLIAAVVLPMLGLRAAFFFLAGLCFAGAVFGSVVIREREAAADVLEAHGLGETLRDRRLLLLCLASSLYLVAQIAITGFVVLFLHDQRGFSPGEAAAVLAGVNVLAAALRIGGGRWSDVIGSRILPLRLVGLASGASLALTVALLDARTAVVVTAFVVAGGFAMAWNGLSFTAAAELAGMRRSGAALGMQQSALSAAGAIVPPAFAAIVAASSWRLGFGLAALFPLLGVQLLRPLRS